MLPIDPRVLQQTLAAVREAMQNPLSNAELEAMKAGGWVQPGSPTSGLVAYDLEAPAKMLIPVLTPLRNSIPRVGGGYGTAHNWRAVTSLNTAGIRIGTSEGNRNAVVTTATANYTAAYKTIGLEDNVSFEADLASQNFQDLKALSVQDLLWALMLGEEPMLLGGNADQAIGQCTAPTLAGSSSGGSLATQTLSVIVAGLTLDGFLNGSVANGVQGAITRTNADGSSDTFGGGTGKLSANTTASITGPSGSCTATTPRRANAYAYAWFWGVAGSEVLGAITTINSINITAAATGTQTAASLGTNDNSTMGLTCDGILPYIETAGSNAYIAVQPTGTAGTGTPLTADTFGGIVEFNTALKSFWDNYRLAPEEIWVSSQEMNNIKNKILSSSSNAAQRFMLNVNDQGDVKGGFSVRSYLNPFTMGGAVEIPIKIHPYLPAGTVLFRTMKLPYKLNNVPNVLQVRTRRDYYQLEWPLRSRKYEYGVYSDQLLQCYFPPSLGIITNIGNG